MRYTSDVTITSPDGETRLLVEVKSREPADAEWARRFRRNILAHFPDNGSAYFLLVLPESLYLWEPDSGPEEEPDYEGSTEKALRPYLEKAEVERLDGRAFEFLVSSWLSDLVALEPSEEELGPALRWLIDSGLYAKIRGGSVEREVAV